MELVLPIVIAGVVGVLGYHFRRRAPFRVQQLFFAGVLALFVALMWRDGDSRLGPMLVALIGLAGLARMKPARITPSSTVSLLRDLSVASSPPRSRVWE